MTLKNPKFLTRLNELSRASDCVWFTGMSVGLVLTLIAAYLFPYPESVSGKFWAYASLFIRGALYLGAMERLRGRGGETLFRLFMLGNVAGILEILVDWWLIHGVQNGRLVYMTENDVVLLGSPIWMPLAWACVIVEIGYPALRLFGLFKAKISERAAAISSSLICALGAGVTVGFYEYFAYLAGWWRYERATWMLGDYCALYIPLGEFLMFLTILPIAARALSDEERPVASALSGGTRFALSIFIGYALAYLLLEYGRFPS